MFYLVCFIVIVVYTKDFFDFLIFLWANTSRLSYYIGCLFWHYSGRAESTAKEKEKEDKVRKIRDLQETERKTKLEELKQHVSLRFPPNIAFILIISGSASTKISRAAREWAKEAYWRAEKQGHGQKAAGQQHFLINQSSSFVNNVWEPQFHWL